MCHSVSKLLAVLIVAGGSRAVIAEDVSQTLVAPWVGAKFELFNVSPNEPMIVPLAVRPNCAVKSAELGEVRLGEHAQPSLLGAFQSEYNEGRLRITAASGLELPPATYGLKFYLLGSCAGAQVFQPLSIELTRSPGELRASPSLLIERTLLDPWAEDRGASLSLLNTSRRTTLAPISVVQLDGALRRDRPSDVRLTARWLPKTALPPGQGVHVPLQFAGWELGTTKGQLEVRAPQLIDPVAVPFEVRVRLSPWLIVPTFLLGGALGFLMRRLLKRLELRQMLQRRAALLRERLRAEIAAPIDDILRERLEQAFEALDSCVVAGETEGMWSGVEQAEKALDEAKLVRERIRTDSARKLADVRNLLSRPWRLPKSVSLGASLEALRRAEELLANDHLVELSSAMGALEAAQRALVDAIVNWSDRLHEQIEPLRGQAPLAATSALQSLEEPIDKLSAAIAAQNEREIEPLLAAADALERALLKRRADAAQQIAVEAHTIENALGVDPKFADRRQSALQARQYAEEAVHAGDGLQLVQSLANSAGELRAIASSLPAVSGERKALADRRYAEGVRDAVHRELQRDGRMKTLMPIEAPTRRNGVDWDLLGLETDPAQQADVVHWLWVQPRGERGSQTSDVIAVAGYDIVRISWMRWAISTVLLALLAWITYSDSWTGSAREFLTIVAIAFTADFTVEAIADAISGESRVSRA